MDAEKSCRRCSVVRVNMLCRLYQEGLRENEPEARKSLAAFVDLARARGYSGGLQLLTPGLSEALVRKTCWNVSSLLNDEDIERFGVNADGRGSRA